MAFLSIPRKREIQGPWLIGQSELEDLDSVIDELDTYLAEALAEQIKEEVKASFEKQEYPLSESGLKRKTKEL